MADVDIVKRRVIIADSKHEEVEELQDLLLRQAFAVRYAHTASDLRNNLSEGDYDLVILGMALPDADGLAVLRWLRLMTRCPGILVRCSTDNEIDRVVTLELGADDCVARTCSLRETIARVRAILRRLPENSAWDACADAVNIDLQSQGDPIASGWVLYNDSRRILTPYKQVIQLTNAEYLVISRLLSEHGAAIDRSNLLESILEDSTYGTRSIDVVVSRLRKKLAKHGGKDLIQTVRGKGYRLNSLPQLDNR
jgi:DNA-binding response OmpR family regulator